MERGEPRTMVAIATYNERGNLALLIQEIHHHAPQVDVVVVDDSSPDGTGELADQLATADPRVHVVHRKGKLGLGTAILAGMQYSIDHGIDIQLVNSTMGSTPYVLAMKQGRRDLEHRASGHRQLRPFRSRQSFHCVGRPRKCIWGFSERRVSIHRRRRLLEISHRSNGSDPALRPPDRAH